MKIVLGKGLFYKLIHCIKIFLGVFETAKTVNSFEYSLRKFSIINLISIIKISYS